MQVWKSSVGAVFYHLSFLVLSTCKHGYFSVVCMERHACDLLEVAETLNRQSCKGWTVTLCTVTWRRLPNTSFFLFDKT